jgi:hypothetical protein
MSREGIGVGSANRRRDAEFPHGFASIGRHMAHFVHNHAKLVTDGVKSPRLGILPESQFSA